MVDFKVTFTIFAFLIAAIKASMLSVNFSGPKEILPTVKCIIGALASVLKLICPPAYFLATSSGFGAIVPFLGFGIKPLGPKTLATLANFAIIVGSATKTSKLIMPFSTSAIKASEAIATRVVLPVPWGRVICPEIPVETIFRCNSTVSSKDFRCNFSKSSNASLTE